MSPTSYQCSSVTDMISHLCVGFLHALGLKALLRHRKPPFHHLELLSTQAATWQSRAPRPGTCCPRVDARSLSFCRDRIRGHARTRTSADFRTSDWQSLEGTSGRKAELLPAAVHCGRILRPLLAESFLRFQSFRPAER